MGPSMATYTIPESVGRPEIPTYLLRLCPSHRLQTCDGNLAHHIVTVCSTPRVPGHGLYTGKTRNEMESFRVDTRI